MKKFIKAIILTLGSLCLFGCSSSAEDLRILEDWKWTDSKQDWKKRVQSCPTTRDTTDMFYGYLGVYGANDMTMKTLDSCRYYLGGVNFIVDLISFTEFDNIKEKDMSHARSIQLKIQDEGEYSQLLKLFSKKYRSCKGDERAEFAFCSKYSEFTFFYDWSSLYQEEIGTLSIDMTNYSKQKISDIIEEQKKKELGPLPKLDSKSF